MFLLEITKALSTKKTIKNLAENWPTMLHNITGEVLNGNTQLAMYVIFVFLGHQRLYGCISTIFDLKAGFLAFIQV